MKEVMRRIGRVTRRVLGGVPMVGRLPGRLAASRNRPAVPQGPEGVKAVGHRMYVGGLWDEIGRLQFEFLLEHGLEPRHYFLDVACGSLRGGVYFIPYLEKGHYLGIDKEPDLIDKGVREELTTELVESKQPQFVVSDTFEFERFSSAPDFALAQSLFTHLPPRIINICFSKLRAVVHPDSVFYATFFEAEQPRENPEDPHDFEKFFYSRQEMKDFGTGNGWSARYIGDWNHPRNQVIVEYRPSAEVLAAMPDAGRDEDFTRREDESADRVFD